MEFILQTKDVELNSRRFQATRTKLDQALDQLASQVDRICVFLIDTNGPFLGGVDKACRVEVKIRRQDPIVLEDRDEDIDTLIDRVASRLGAMADRRQDAAFARRSFKARYLTLNEFAESMQA